MASLKVKLRWKEYVCQQRMADVLPYLIIDPSQLTFTREGGEKMVTVKSNLQWTVNKNKDWTILNPAGFTGSVNQKITCSPYPSDNLGRYREDVVTYINAAANIQRSLRIKQIGQGLFLDVPETIFLSLDLFRPIVAIESYISKLRVKNIPLNEFELRNKYLNFGKFICENADIILLPVGGERGVVYAMDNKYGSLEPFTFSRNSKATLIDETNQLSVVDKDMPRLDYRNYGRIAKLLIEQESKNLAIPSNTAENNYNEDNFTFSISPADNLNEHIITELTPFLRNNKYTISAEHRIPIANAKAQLKVYANNANKDSLCLIPLESPNTSDYNYVEQSYYPISENSFNMGVQAGGMNLISNSPSNWKQGAYLNANGNYYSYASNYICIATTIEVKPNTEYIVSHNENYRIDKHFRKADGTYINFTAANKFTTGSEVEKMTFNVRKIIEANIIPSEIVNVKIQVEELEVASSFLSELYIRRLQIELGDKTSFIPVNLVENGVRSQDLLSYELKQPSTVYIKTSNVNAFFLDKPAGIWNIHEDVVGGIESIVIFDKLLTDAERSIILNDSRYVLKVEDGIEGMSNAEIIKYLTDIGDLNVQLDEDIYYVDDISCVNGLPIPNDPGKEGHYKLKINYSLGENVPSYKQYRYVNIIADNEIIKRVRIEISHAEYSDEYNEQYF